MPEAKDMGLGRVLKEQLVSAYVRSEKFILAQSDRPRLGGAEKAIRDQQEILSRVTEPGIFKYISGEDEKRSIQTAALTASKDFWIKKLEESELSADVAAIGNRRIKEISQRLEVLTKPSESSQP